MKRARPSGDDEERSASLSKILRRCTSPSTSIHHVQQQQEDRISSLPDYILLLILSLVGGRGEEGEIEQVVRTSVLARRWRYLWTDALKSLTFDFKERESFSYDDEDGTLYRSTCRDFVNRVNLILQLHPGETIDDFTLSFWLGYRVLYRKELDNWFDFALRKRVKRLCFEFTFNPNCFTLTPDHIQGRNMDSLVSLSLGQVDVTGEVLEYLLTLCGSLQHLSISNSTTLVDLTVSGQRLKLKHLRIHHCWNLRRLCIRDIKLASFEYHDVSDSTVVIENTPHLVNGHLVKEDNTAKILRYLRHQLQALVLEFDINLHEVRPTIQFPKLMSLMRLELVIGQPAGFSCFICSSLLVSSPSIRELKLTFKFLNDKCAEDEVQRLERPHECLKVVELVGFVGEQHDTQVALYIIENTLSLERFLVDTSHPHRSSAPGMLWRDIESETRERARAKADELLGPRLLLAGTRFFMR